MRILLIDNHDSFTFNLAHLIHRVTGSLPIVIPNDAMGWDAAAALGAQAVVLSPGPGRPEVPGDIGLCADAIAQANVPILGVCLGHQALAHAAGARIVHAPEPRHGRISAIRHEGSDLFAGLPDGFAAVRYHSLAAVDLPPSLEALAWSEEGVVMALRHRTLPWRGVQFHPESISSEHGALIFANFLDATLGPDWRHGRNARVTVDVPSPSSVTAAAAPVSHRLVHRRLDLDLVAEDVFAALHAASPEAFWLDSSGATPGHARFSFMGDASGPRAMAGTYDLGTRQLSLRTAAGPVTHEGDCLDILRMFRDRHRIEPVDLPFAFGLGWVGCLGYELKAQTGGTAAHQADTPDAALIFADRAIAFDHEQGAVWLLALAPLAPDHAGLPADVAAWFTQTEARLRACPPALPVTPPSLAEMGTPNDPAVSYRLDRTRYLEAIAACRRALVDGESYELCLTNRISRAGAIDPFATYRLLRRLSPAPYGAFLRLPGLAVLSASPERFLAIDAKGNVETRPIKGTRGRGGDPATDAALARDLATSEKDRAENLMIVDLLRNDLSRVAIPGSVEVHGLFAVESFAQVHQLVSTVRARLAPGRDAIDCVQACFPGGSMTGAPKERSMCILDGLEPGPRGLYSGALGYLSLDGAADLAIVIRTIVATAALAHYGIGGAIVALSDAADEWTETLIKGRALAAVLKAAPVITK